MWLGVFLCIILKNLIAFRSASVSSHLRIEAFDIYFLCLSRSKICSHKMIVNMLWHDKRYPVTVLRNYFWVCFCMRCLLIGPWTGSQMGFLPNSIAALFFENSVIFKWHFIADFTASSNDEEVFQIRQLVIFTFIDQRCPEGHFFIVDSTVSCMVNMAPKLKISDKYATDLHSRDEKDCRDALHTGVVAPEGIWDAISCTQEMC